MKQVDHLILGGGIAGTTAAEEIRSKDKESSISIVTKEANRLYSRVLLPHFLRNENTLESVFVRTVESYQEKNIQLRTSTKIVKIEPSRKLVITETGEEIEFGKLLIATGGKVNQFHLPGSDLAQVVYLQTLEDAQKIKSQILEAKEAVVIGGGFIAIELAQSFIKNGLKTTVILREKSFWEGIVGENSGKLLGNILASNGVVLLPETQVSEFGGVNGQLKRVLTNTGQELRADLAGVGIGVHMELSHLNDSGIRLNKGILTNEFLETSEKDIWAAGDIAEFHDPLLGKPHQLGNWANASSQGRAVGLNMLGEKNPFVTNSLYSINIFNINFSFLGDPMVDSETEIIERGSVESGKLARLLLRHETIIGASLINLPVERSQINRLVTNKVKVTVNKEKLSDLSFDLSTIQ